MVTTGATPQPLAGSDRRNVLAVLFFNGIITEEDVSDVLWMLRKRHPRLTELLAAMTNRAAAPQAEGGAE